MTTRGKIQYFPWGNTQESITNLLEDPRISNYVRGSTYASKREAIRKLLRQGKLTPSIVDNLPFTSLQQPHTLYGSQRRRAQLPLKRTTGQVTEGPRLTHDKQYDGPFDPTELLTNYKKYGALRRDQPLRNRNGEILEGPRRLPKVRIPKGKKTVLSFNGERTSALRAIERFPRLKKYLMEQGRQGVKDKTLAKRLLKLYKKGNLPTNLTHFFEPRRDDARSLRNDYLSRHVIENPDRNATLLTFMGQVRNTIVKLLEENPNKKVQLNLTCTLVDVHRSDEDGIDRRTRHFWCEPYSVYANTDCQEAFLEMSRQVVNKFDAYQGRKSGLVLEVVKQLAVTFFKLVPLRGSSYLPLPKIGNKQALINIKNKDNFCFKYAVTRGLHPVEKDPQRVTLKLREQTELYDWTGVEFPTPLSGNSIKKFEETNKVGVGVFGCTEDDTVVPLRVPTRGYDRNVDLFYLQNTIAPLGVCLA